MMAVRPAQPRTRSPDGRAEPPDVAKLLDEAVARLQTGSSIDECLAALPEPAAELRSLLETALLVQQLSAPAPPPGAKARVRAQVMAAAEARLGRARRASRPGWRRQPLGAAVAASGAVLLGGGVVAASASALPGEPLYPVKLAVEQAHVAAAELQGDPATKVELQNELAARRIAEAEALASQDRTVPPGVVESAVRHLETAGRLAAQLPASGRDTAERRLAEAQAKQAEKLERVLKQVPPPAQTPLARIIEQERGAGATPKSGPAGSRGGAERASPPAASIATPTPGPASRQEEGEAGRGGAGRSGSTEGSGSRPATPPASRDASRDAGGRGNEPRADERRPETPTGGPQRAPVAERQEAQGLRETRDQAGPGNLGVRQQDQVGPGTSGMREARDQIDQGNQNARHVEDQLPVDAEHRRDTDRSNAHAREPAVSAGAAAGTGATTADQDNRASQADSNGPGGNERGGASPRRSQNDTGPALSTPPVPLAPAEEEPSPGGHTRSQRSGGEAGSRTAPAATGVPTGTPTPTPTVPGRGERGGSGNGQGSRR